jgi:RNA polymerase sigma-70 factor (ECF subfamily)
LKLRLTRAKKPPTPVRMPVDEGPGALRALSPEDLAERAAAGSVASYGELVTRFEARVFNFLLRKMGSRADAEDLAQEAFVRAWERIKSYDRQWRFSTWLFTIASRLAVSHYRRQRPVVSSGELDRADAPCGEADRDSEADKKLGAHLWVLAAETLGEEQHEALWLRYAEDMEIGEIAAVMGKTHVSVRVCLFRARQALAGAWEDRENKKRREVETKAAAAREAKAEEAGADGGVLGLAMVAGRGPLAGGVR